MNRRMLAIMGRRAPLLGFGQRSFQPTDVTGLNTWLEASDVTTSGSDVTAWGGRGGGNSVSSLSGSAPTYEATGFNTSYPSVRFTKASSQWAAVDAAASVVSGTDKEFTIVMAVQVVSSASGDTYLGFARSSAVNPAHRFLRPLGSANYSFIIKDDAATLVQQDMAGLDANPHVVSWRVRSNTGMKIDVYKDGTQIGTNVAFDVGAMTLDRCTIGAQRSTTTSLFADIRVNKVLIYTGALSDTDWSLVRNWARTSVGL